MQLIVLLSLVIAVSSGLLIALSWVIGLTYDVQNFLHKCPVCQELQGRKPIPSPLNPLPTVAEPNMRVHMDLFGPLKVRLANGKKYIMVMS